MGKVEWLKASAKKAYHYYKRNGLAAMTSAVAERLSQEAKEKYSYVLPAETELSRQRERVSAWINPPLISIVVPAFETPEQYLEELLDSLQAQTYPRWELILADVSESNVVRRTVEKHTDSRVRYVKLEENKGISLNTNEAIRLASGEYIGLLDHDDFLTPDALYEMASAIAEKRKQGTEPVFLYSDEDKCDGEGKEFYEPHLKLDFNFDLLLSNNYICHFLVMRADVMKKLELRAEFDGAQDYDLVLRAAAGIWKDADRIHLGTDAEFVHIPKVLYHWRCHRDSTASNPESKRYAYEAGKRALEELAANLGWKVKVEHTRHLGFYRCEFEPSALVQRTDVGALASPMPSRSGKFISGIYDICRTGEASRLIDDEKTDCEKLSSEDISMRYAGLRNGFGGYLHRAELTQDVEIADVRTLQVRPEYEKDLQEAMEQIRSGADPVRTSVAFCQKIRNDGRRILWIPFK